ncbi:MAG: PAS domain S-box protein [Bacteroidetes bacterium]|nr:MAG: PAS domain S-box protein [Bacteroidota bacterium]
MEYQDPSIWSYQINSGEWSFSEEFYATLGYPLQGGIAITVFAFNYKTELENSIRDYALSMSSAPFSAAALCQRSDGHLAMLVFRGFLDSSLVQVKGDIVPVQEHLRNQQELEDAHQRMQLIAEGFRTGLWDWNILSGKKWWSDQFYHLLGYQPEEIPSSYETFMRHLVHPEDKPQLERSILSHLNEHVPLFQEIRLQMKSGSYRWFELSGKASFNQASHPERVCGAIVDIHKRKTAELEVATQEFMLREGGKLVKVGAWEIELENMALTWSQGVFEIHELPLSFQPTVESAIQFYIKEHVPLITECVDRLMRFGIAYDIELEIKTAKGRRIWVRGAAEALRNEAGKIVKIRGVFQDIHEKKTKELELEESMEYINDQNKRLMNFAHIVSHNLRSYTGNLHSLVDILKEAKTEEEREEILQNLSQVSDHLKETVQNLNEVVAVNSDLEKERIHLDIHAELKRVQTLLESDLNRVNAKVEIQESSWDHVFFIKSYLESILLNLFTNAIKYRSPDRQLEINIKLLEHEGHKELHFCDNGQGIDLKQHGDKIFGLYRTFHQNKEARGIGLFMTKNQIESIGGSIQVLSTVNQGTCFIIVFR